MTQSTAPHTDRQFKPRSHRGEQAPLVRHSERAWQRLRHKARAGACSAPIATTTTASSAAEATSAAGTPTP